MNSALIEAGKKTLEIKKFAEDQELPYFVVHKAQALFDELYLKMSDGEAQIVKEHAKQLWRHTQ